VALALSTIRTRVATALTAAGFRESRFGYELFGSDPQHVQHKTFSVGLTTTAAEPRRRGQLAVHTVVSIKWSARVRADAQVSDYGAALDLEETIVAAVRGASKVNMFSLDYVSTPQREIAPTGDWFIGRVDFQAQHFYEV
tara:strand:+ start:6361 stop:6780 length:420 start_codon:yes stop_codon:yes gene_type:complete